MSNDPIVDRVHKIREKLAKKFNYDVNAIFADIREKQKRHSHREVNLRGRRKADQPVSAD
ncbi:MAG: hypothetical protein P9X24_16155 [Candidatus Hatepunaea meridiana]|nr:hypothetical protein [Candidatus Hatepunaea meridiana]